jgi:hypothetical protein
MNAAQAKLELARCDFGNRHPGVVPASNLATIHEAEMDSTSTRCTSRLLINTHPMTPDSFG